MKGRTSKLKKNEVVQWISDKENYVRLHLKHVDLEKNRSYCSGITPCLFRKQSV